ncbi:PepSY domain-containing protein [Nannocystis radixulma]|uniref:PepSY domain-containing protein n=1 Tax=Nannocystis radixulma TaxID=2995305 RepID=A0ABT5B3X7_9BACT|nr:PepSY domain-containing protein [Nannocystis radixulma]MDC0667837.1 PepSY domain-containing protein [Nannocystis radixulma]
MLTIARKSLFIVTTMLLAVGCDLADDRNVAHVREAVTGAESSLAEAIDAAAQAVPAGVLVDAELEVEASKPVYEVRLLDGDALTKVHVDPDTAAVLRTEVDTDADDIADATAAAAVLHDSPLDPAAAIATAEAERPGGIAFEFEVKDGLLEVEVVDDAGLFEIRIDPADGSVVEVDISDDHGGANEPGDDNGGANEPGDDNGGA